MDGRVCMFCMLPFGEDGFCGCKPINPFPYQCHKWPFPINFNTNERTPESQRLIDEADPKRKQPSLACLTDNRSIRVNLSDIEDALM